MAILAGSCSFTRYRIVEEVPRELLPEVPERLLKHAFRDIDDNADEQSFGWVCMDDMLDTEWRSAPPEKGSYFTFALRLDTRRIPAAVFKKYITMALKEEEAKAQEQGRKFVGRERKKELREQVRLKLMARTLPIPATFDVVWNIENHIIYFDSTRSAVREMFEELFTDTFELHLEPQTPFFLALHELGSEHESKLEALESAHFV